MVLLGVTANPQNRTSVGRWREIQEMRLQCACACVVCPCTCRGLFHPCVQDSEGKWVLDLKSRYLWEDVPCGLVAMKGVAQLMGVPTPSIDR
jgi:hypothetical protein